MSDWSGGVPFFCFVSADQFSYQQDGSGDEDDQNYQNREVGDDGYEKVYEEIADFVEAVSKAVADAAAYGVGGRLFVGYFGDVEVDGAVVHQVVVGSKLGFVAVDLVAEIGEFGFEGQDLIQFSGLFEKFTDTVVFGPEGIQVGFLIDVSEGDVFGFDIFVGDGAQSSGSFQETIQVVGRDPGSDVVGASAVAVLWSIQGGGFDIATAGGDGVVQFRAEGVKIFGGDIHRDGADHFPGALVVCCLSCISCSVRTGRVRRRTGSFSCGGIVHHIRSAVIGEAGVVQRFAGFDSPGVRRFILVDRRGGCRTSATGEKQDATQKE